MRAWTYQDPHQLKRIGPENACYYVGWIDPAGKRRCKSCGPGSRGKKAAERLAHKIEAELIEGTYHRNADRVTWAVFRKEFETQIVAGMDASTRRCTLGALNNFERIIKPVRLVGVKTQTIDAFKVKRLHERGKKRESTVSKATVNKELRHLRAAFRKAHKWGYMPVLPDFTFEREPKKLPTYVTPEQFTAIYLACDGARYPDNQPYSAGDWWRGLIVMAYMTGWRISELLALRREDMDLDAGYAITRWDDNKGKREERVKLHPVVIEHLRKLVGFDTHIFPWDLNETTLYQEHARIQEQAGIKKPCRAAHKHTRFCYVFGFHDLRRAFATMNADRLSADALQSLMRHESYQTTQRYIAIARQLDSAVDLLHVPPVLQAKKA